MIEFASIHHAISSQPYIIRSKVRSLGGDTRICLMIKSNTEHTVSIIEEFFMEAMGDVSWETKTLDEDFSYVTEKYNKFIKNIDRKSENISIFFGANIGELFVFSIIGEIFMIMKEAKRKWSLISEAHNHEQEEFSYISSGVIPYDSTIYIGSENLMEIMESEILDDMSCLNVATFEDTMVGWFNKEISKSCDVIRIQRERVKSNVLLKHSHQIDIARERVGSYFRNLQYGERFQKIALTVDNLFRSKPKSIQTGIVVTGVLLCFFLLYILFNEIFNLSTDSEITDTKQQLIEARGFLETAEKNLSNNALFNENIKKAENLLFGLRKDEVYLKDTQEMLAKISTLKKELYDVETFEIEANSSIMPFNPQDISPVRIFEFNKKLSVIGKYGAIFDYVENSTIPKVSAYPLGEEAIDADISSDGTLYILTKSSKILSKRQNEIVYVPISSPEGWEKALRIKTYNSNLYLLGENKNEILRHKPGVNGFGPKSSILQSYSGSDIRDVGIDGGFFLLKNGGQIRRIITSPSYTEESITLNNIPGEYELSSDSNLMLFVRPNLSYIYLLDGSRIWIFQPDSKNYKDIRSWKYIAQIEVSSKEEIRSFFIPYDGMIYIASNLGIYTIKYEIANGKIILK